MIDFYWSISWIESIVTQYPIWLPVNGIFDFTTLSLSRERYVSIKHFLYVKVSVSTIMNGNDSRNKGENESSSASLVRVFCIKRNEDRKGNFHPSWNQQWFILECQVSLEVEFPLQMDGSGTSSCSCSKSGGYFVLVFIFLFKIFLSPWTRLTQYIYTFFNSHRNSRKRANPSVSEDLQRKTAH